VIQNPERAVIVKGFQQVEGFKIIGRAFSGRPALM
jgi:hypothetical protein